MGIQKITQLATNVLSRVQKMPLPKQLGLAALATTGVFGLGVLAGQALFGDSFEKEAKNDNSETFELVNTNTTPQTELEDKKEKLQKIEYSRPTGNDIKADTIAIFRDGNPAQIEYSRNGIPFEIEHLCSDGSYGGKASITYNGTTRMEKHENAYGQYDYAVEKFKDGTEISTFDGISNWEVENKALDPTYYNNSVTRYIHKGDKTIVEDFDTYVDPKRKRKETVERFDSKTGDYILEQEKFYDDTGLLKYKVTPKYNQDGDLIKRDTVWVNK